MAILHSTVPATDIYCLSGACYTQKKDGERGKEGSHCGYVSLYEVMDSETFPNDSKQAFNMFMILLSR